MQPITDATALLTAGGVAVTVYLIVQFAVKPWMRRKYPEQGADYEAMMNTIALALAEALAFASAMILTPRPEWTGQMFLTAFLVGLAGAVAAIGAHEALTNVNRARAE